MLRSVQNSAQGQASMISGARTLGSSGAVATSSSDGGPRRHWWLAKPVNTVYEGDQLVFTDKTWLTGESYKCYTKSPYGIQSGSNIN